MMIQIHLIPADTIYIIRHKELYDPFFFLYDAIDILPDVDTVLWTPNQNKAREFYSEESVETYFYDKLRDRPCEIVCIK